MSGRIPQSRGYDFTGVKFHYPRDGENPSRVAITKTNRNGNRACLLVDRSRLPVSARCALDRAETAYHVGRIDAEIERSRDATKKIKADIARMDREEAEEAEGVKAFTSKKREFVVLSAEIEQVKEELDNKTNEINSPFYLFYFFWAKLRAFVNSLIAGAGSLSWPKGDTVAISSESTADVEET